MTADFNRCPEGSGRPKLAKSPFVGFFLAADAPAAVAVTDAGRQLPLFFYEVALTVPKDEHVDPACRDQREMLLLSAEQHFLQNVKCNREELKRISGPELGTNCHGWVFLGGRIGVKDEHVPQILEDNGYLTVDNPAAGDLAIYIEGRSVTHSGVVVSAAGSVQVESKWGPFSVFRHAADNYHRGMCTFWRAARAGHTLAVRAKAVATPVINENRAAQT